MSMYLDVMCGFGIETGNRERDVMCHVSCVVIGILKFTRVFRGRQHGKKVGKKEEVSSSKVRVARSEKNCASLLESEPPLALMTD